jgi:mannose-6-phosphate isomerase-like protein (cupin superfamily)
MIKNPIDKHSAKRYVWGQNCESFILLNKSRLSIKQEIMPAKTKEQLHFHKHAQQFFYILKGTAVFYLDNDIINLNALQGVEIDPEVKHYIANETDMDLEFLVISQPTADNDRIVEMT